MAELFGFRITRSKDEGKGNTFTLPTPDDGAVEIAGGGFFGSILDTDGREKDDFQLLRKYRQISQQPECDAAVEDIVNEAVVADNNDQSVSIVLDRLPYTEKIKRKIRNEFDEVLSLLDFDIKGHDIFRRWYVDGRIFYHKVIDNKNPRKGITELRWIDPLKIKKVREVDKETDPKTGVEIIKKINEYFIYNEKGLELRNAGTQGVKIANASITFVPSGL